MGRVSAVPAPGCASTDVATSVFGGTSNRKRSSMGRVITVPVPGRGVFSLWSSSAIPTGVNGPLLKTTDIIVMLYDCANVTLAEEKHEDSCGKKARPLKNYRL